MRPLSALILVGAALTIASRGGAAPAPVVRKGVMEDADALLAKAYPKQMKEIKGLPHRFVLHLPEAGGTTLHAVVAAKRVTFGARGARVRVDGITLSGPGEVVLSGVWLAEIKTKKNDDKIISMKTKRLYPTLRLQFHRPVKTINDFNKAKVAELFFDTPGIGPVFLYINAGEGKK